MKHTIEIAIALGILLTGISGAAQPPLPKVGQEYSPPSMRGGGPSVFAHSDDVLPDQSFVVTGAGLKGAEAMLWGPSATQAGGQKWPVKIQSQTDSMVVATVPEQAPAGLYLLWFGSGGNWSAPVRLNAPEMWWSTPDRAAAGETIRVCGRNLAQKPDHIVSPVYLRQAGKDGQWLTPVKTDKYYLDLALPTTLAPGRYEVWVHAGSGGAQGWGSPFAITVEPRRAPGRERVWDGKDPARLQQVVKAGEGVVRIPAGTFILPQTLEIPAGVQLTGAGAAATILALSADAKPEGDRRAAVRIGGSRSGLRDLTVIGNSRVNWGLLVEHPDKVTWLEDVALERVRVAGEDSRGGESGAVRIQHTARVRVTNCELHGRAPLFLSGVRQGWFVSNRLAAASRYTGGAEGAILSRTETLAQSIFEDNIVASPVGGSPQVRRLIWVSTGHGSVNDNLFLRNRAENPRFSGVGGTDQNVGETILLESHMRYAYYGSPEQADDTSVTIPADAPFLPPMKDDGTMEPTATEYYVAVLQGKGLAQVRRVAGRDGRRLLLDSPWSVAPDKESRIVVTTLFARNLILENETMDGMTGIQLWIGGWENVIARNRIARERRQGIYLYAATTTLAAQMPPTWNRGIGVLLFNTVEENSMENCSEGIRLSSNNSGQAVEWPRAIGNLLRRNTAVASRGNGIAIAGSKPVQPASVWGTVAEFNVLRDQSTGITTDEATLGSVVRRNLIYVWDAWLLSKEPKGLNLRGEGAAQEFNDLEGSRGEKLR